MGNIHIRSTQALQAASFVCNLPFSDCGWYLGHTWSLAFEEQFYILFPITLVALTPRSRRTFLLIWLSLPPLILGSYLLKYAALAHYLSTFELLLAGVVTAFFADYLQVALARVPSFAAYLSIVLIFFLYDLPTNRITTTLMVVVACPLIGLVLFYTSHFPCALKRILSLPPIRYMGRLSYGLYLWQQLATGYRAGAGALFYASTLALTLLWCLLSFRYLESPLIALASRLSKQQIAKELAARFVQTSEFVSEDV